MGDPLWLRAEVCMSTAPPFVQQKLHLLSGVMVVVVVQGALEEMHAFADVNGLAMFALCLVETGLVRRGWSMRQ